MADIFFKKGDTFIATCTYHDGTDPGSLDEISIYSQIKNHKGRKIADLDVEKSDTTLGVFTVTSETDTWPENINVFWDIRYEKDGVIFSTETINVFLYKEITKIPEDD
jgi:hypothetical protein